MQELQEQVFSAELTAAELSRLVGPLDENLRQIENAFGVQVLGRRCRSGLKTRRGAHSDR